MPQALPMAAPTSMALSVLLTARSSSQLHLIRCVVVGPPDPQRLCLDLRPSPSSRAPFAHAPFAFRSHGSLSACSPRRAVVGDLQLRTPTQPRASRLCKALPILSIRSLVRMSGVSINECLVLVEAGGASMALRRRRGLPLQM